MRDAYEDAVLSHVAHHARRTELMNHSAMFLIIAGVIVCSPPALPSLIACSAVSICAHAVLSNIEGSQLRKEFQEASAQIHSAEMMQLQEKIENLGRPLFKPVFTHPLNIALSSAFVLAAGFSSLVLTIPAMLLGTETLRIKNVNNAVRQIQNNGPH